MDNDLVIRGATVVDGTGARARRADVGIRDGLVVEIGEPSEVGRGHRQIDAEGLTVTPGFVDIHSHYDGQVSWDPLLRPSLDHGVTTTVMGNCGVGFAPAAPDRHDWLIQLMEGVEDIPGAALAEGIDWQWESFPEYLDALQAKAFAMDVATQVPHGTVRAYVMGDRANGELATVADLEAMSAIVTDGMRAGALGFTSSRTMLHRALDGKPVPGTFAGGDEMIALGMAVVDGGGGVFEVASDVGLGAMDGRFHDDLDWFERLADQTGLTVTYTLLQSDTQPEQWREMIDRTSRMGGAGRGRVLAQVAGRPTGMLLGLQTSLHPFKLHPTFRALDALPLQQRLAELQRPDVRATILAEQSEAASPFNKAWALGFWKMFPLGDPPDYEPHPDQSVEAIARRQGVEPAALAYDLLIANGGTGFLFFPLNDYAGKNLDPTLERLQRDDVVLSLADGGAHCRLVCDASTPTYMLSYWARDRRRGPTLPIEHVVAMQTSRTAAVYGLSDRGIVAPGYRADLNIIDAATIGIDAPRMVADLPASGNRLLQAAHGYRATIVAGVATMEHGEHTGALPGRLIRGRRG